MSEKASYFQTRLLATRDALNSIKDLQHRQHIIQGMMTELGATIEAHICEDKCKVKENGPECARKFRDETISALEMQVEFNDEEVENQASEVMIIDEQYYPIFPRRIKESVELMLQFVDRTSNQKLEGILSRMLGWSIRHGIIDPSKAPDKEVYASTVASIRPPDDDDNDDEDKKKK